MKTQTASIIASLLLVAPLAQGGPPREAGQRPCFSVNVQNDRVNEARVEQNCYRNYSRTVQAGRDNRVETIQTGEVNDNKVRQYSYGHLR
jgi:hypothetical protein